MDLKSDLRNDHFWALLLAGGEGSRLSPLTRNKLGQAVPKQYCSLGLGPSLLQATIHRAEGMTDRDRITTVVCESHKEWWGEQLGALRPENIFVQSGNRGTGIGILWPLLLILSRDPEADLVILPTDHYFRNDSVLCDAVLEARRSLSASPDGPILLGIRADRVEPDLGWIVPGESRNHSSLRGVVDFVEKPDQRMARHLLNRGAVWNSFILISRARSLLELFRSQLPALTSQLEDALNENVTEWDPLSPFGNVCPVDFSRDVLQGAEDRLSVMSLAASGWSDLGTPERLRSCLSRQSPGESAARGPSRRRRTPAKLFCFSELLSSFECP